MKILKDFLSEYGATIISAIISFILGYIGIVAKSLLKRLANDKTKKDVVATCVRAVEQIFTDLHGQEKLHKCIENATAILESKGIDVSADEIYMLIEASVKDMNMQMNDMFNSDDSSNDDDSDAPIEIIDDGVTDIAEPEDETEASPAEDEIGLNGEPIAHEVPLDEIFEDERKSADEAQE